MFTSEKLTEGSIYTRGQLQQMFSTRDATINTGVFQPSGYQSVWLFVNENSKQNSTQYKNLLQEDTLTWDGQNEGRTDQLIIEHEKRGIELLVFYRKKKRANGFRYEGRFRYVNHTGSKPTHFVLRRVASVAIKNNIAISEIKEIREENTPNSPLVNKQEHSAEEEQVSAKMEQNKQLKLVYCYAREDHALLEKLENHLSVLKYHYNLISWFDRAITPGMEWKKEIDAQLSTADIILLLISPNFMASRYCYEVEMQRAIERHKRGEARVIPIILRPIAGWKNTPIGELQVLPTAGKPVTDRSWRLDDALLNVAEGLERVIN
jgi:hypothetical protein